MESLSFFASLLYKTERLHVAVRLLSDSSQKTSKCGNNISDTLVYITAMIIHVFTSFSAAI